MGIGDVACKSFNVVVLPRPKPDSMIKQRSSTSGPKTPLFPKFGSDPVGSSEIECPKEELIPSANMEFARIKARGSAGPVWLIREDFLEMERGGDGPTPEANGPDRPDRRGLSIALDSMGQAFGE